MNTLIVGAEQLLTFDEYAGRVPLHGHKMRDIGLVEKGAVAISGNDIVAYGETHELLSVLEIDGETRIIDAKGKIVTPGLVDSHTHPVFTGTREAEFAMRIEGKSYMEIAAAGGGILNTAKRTRETTREQMAHNADRYLEWMLGFGVTSAEAKSGYGLDLETELAMLQAIRYLAQTGKLDLVPTFLGAHEIPAEFRPDRADEFVDVVCEEMIPKVAELELAKFCDVFCEEGVFDIDQTRKICIRAKEFGMGIKLHADEIQPMGGTELGVELGATSVDHMIEVSPRGIEMIAGSNTVATLLPGTSLFLNKGKFAPARDLIDAGAIVALATDFNPGSSPTANLPLIMSLACVAMRMTPEEVWSATTINAAFAVGLGEKIGSISAGKQADVVIWDVPDYRQVPYFYGINLVDTVIKNGRIAHRK
ncbi:MAG TPA: imidazolonepropionase [candidate division Zixibacteria bacterium]|nr:imidazolonepropionase [candidate division Zixibacteria bacterium]